MTTGMLFTDCRLVDVRAGVVREGDLLVRDGRIAATGRIAAAAAGAEALDLGGRYVLPGLLSLHVHPGMMEALRTDANGLDEPRMRRDLSLWARFGVTTVQSMGTDRDVAFDVARARRPGEARLLTVGHGFGVRDAVPQFQMDPPGPLRESDPARVRPILEDLRARGASGVKLWYDDWYGQYPRMAEAVARAIIEGAAQLGLRTYAHVYRVDDAKALVRMGVSTLAHMPRDRVADAELWALMREHDVAVVPTLIVPDSNIVWLDEPAFLDDPLFRLAVPADAPAYLRSAAYHAQIRAKPEFPRLRHDLADAMANVGGAHAAGVPFGFGTDTGVSQRVVGYGEHRELELLVASGVGPAAAIRMATLDSAAVLGRDDLGELAAGRSADLVVLREDPLRDVRALRTIEAVWIAGERVAGRLAG